MPKSISSRVRVAYYARAAQDSDTTRELLVRHAERARAQILARSDWILTETSADIGSGLHVQPCLRRLLDQAREGRFDLLLIERLSDLGRSLDTVTKVLTELHTADVDLCTVGSERIDTATGPLITVLLMTVDEHQRSTVTQRQSKRKG